MTIGQSFLGAGIALNRRIEASEVTLYVIAELYHRFEHSLSIAEQLRDTHAHYKKSGSWLSQTR